MHRERQVMYFTERLFIGIGVGFLLCLQLTAGTAVNAQSAATAGATGAEVSPKTQGATVTGTIRDQTGAVVVNAEVQMLNLASGKQHKAKSDSSGKYEFTGLPPGPYQVSVSSEGFAAVARSISLRFHDAYRADF